MGFRGQDFSFDSPAAAIAGMIARLGSDVAMRTVEQVALQKARGRILAEPVVIDRDSPAFDYSAMDGYAVRAADLVLALEAAPNGQFEFTVVGEARIGSAPPVLPVKPEAANAVAIRIVTGAAIPAGADAIVKREDVAEISDGHRVAAISMAAQAVSKVLVGDHIRRRGENARAGEPVLDAGTELTAAALGTLASVGCTAPRVCPRVGVAIITTGDELVSPESIPDSFQIRNSNAPAIRAVLGAPAWIEIVSTEGGSFAHAGDEEGELDAVLRAALLHADAVVITGGVSMGHRDPVRAAVERCGAEVVFHGLPQRPGKPMLGAVIPRAAGPGIPIFGLPGNPISAMVTCIRIALPVIASLAGARLDRIPQTCNPRLVPLNNPDGKTLDMWWHRLVRINRSGEAELVDGRGSGDIIAGGRSHGFIEVAPTTLQSGHALVPFYPWPT